MKKAISLILTLVLVLSLVPLAVIPVQAETFDPYALYASVIQQCMERNKYDELRDEAKPNSRALLLDLDRNGTEELILKYFPLSRYGHHSGGADFEIWSIDNGNAVRIWKETDYRAELYGYVKIWLTQTEDGYLVTSNFGYGGTAGEGETTIVYSAQGNPYPVVYQLSTYYYRGGDHEYSMTSNGNDTALTQYEYIAQYNLATSGTEPFVLGTELEGYMLPDMLALLTEDSTAIAASGTCGENVTWTLDLEGTLTISGTGEMDAYSFYEYYDKINSLVIEDGVTSIGNDAFAYCSYLTSVEISDTVTSIGDYAFDGCRKLSSVDIPDGVTHIGTRAFADCSSLTDVDIPDGVTSIEGGVFSGCSSLTSVVIPNGVTCIEACAFYECTSLTDVEIPDSVTSIERLAFNMCTSLTSVEIPASVTSIGEEAFGNYSLVAVPDAHGSGLEEIHFRGDAPAIGENCFQDVTAAAYYPADNETWTEDIMQNYGGDITWIAEKPMPPRTAGANRFETSTLSADRMKENLGIEKFDAVVVASGMEFADALSGSYLAAVKNAPILLACGVESIDAEIKDYIKANLKDGGTVYILGGVNAIPDSFKTGLEAFNVVRLAGSNRFETNLKVLEEAGVGDKTILVATGLNFADCLSASATGLPILLVYGSSLTDAQADFLSGNQNPLCILGGTGAVSEQLETQLKGFGTVERLAGADRFQTSVLIAEKFFENPGSAVLAYAWNFPDGLCGGPLAATMGAPLILTMENWEQQAANYIQTQGIQTGIILGGNSLIPDTSVNTIFNIQ